MPYGGKEVIYELQYYFDLCKSSDLLHQNKEFCSTPVDSFNILARLDTLLAK